MYMHGYVYVYCLQGVHVYVRNSRLLFIDNIIYMWYIYIYIYALVYNHYINKSSTRALYDDIY